MRVIFSLNIRVQTMDFERQIGFLLDGEDLPEKVGCRKETIMGNSEWHCLVMTTGGMPNDGNLVSVKSRYMNVLTDHVTFHQYYVVFLCELRS